MFQHVLVHAGTTTGHIHLSYLANKIKRICQYSLFASPLPLLWAIGCFQRIQHRIFHLLPGMVIRRWGFLSSGFSFDKYRIAILSLSLSSLLKSLSSSQIPEFWRFLKSNHLLQNICIQWPRAFKTNLHPKWLWD